MKPNILLRQESRDGLENLIAQLGTSQDKRASSTFSQGRILGDVELSAMYRTDWVSAKVVDIIPDDCTREWRTVDEPSWDEQDIHLFEKEEQRLNVVEIFNEADKWARLYGGSGIVLSVEGTGSPDTPLNIEEVTEGSFSHMNVFDKTWLKPSVIITQDPMSKNFGLPEFYSLNGSATRIHHSRILRFEGVKLPYLEMTRNQYWPDSSLMRMYESIINFTTATDSSASMIFEANVDVIQIEGLMNKLANPQQEELMRKRFMLAKLLKSFNSTHLLDKSETYQKATNTFTGVSDLINKFGLILTAASDIPATRFLGHAASGFNATGEGDQKNYYDNLKARQTRSYSPKLFTLDQIMIQSLGLKLEGCLSFKWNSLFQLSDVEQAQVNLSNAQKSQIYYDMGAIDETVVAKGLLKSGEYSSLDEDYIQTLEADTEENSIEGGLFNGKTEEGGTGKNGSNTSEGLPGGTSAGDTGDA